MHKLRGLIKLLPEIFRFARETRRIWISIIILLLVLVGVLVILTESAAVMPFIYTLF